MGSPRKERKRRAVEDMGAEGREGRYRGQPKGEVQGFGWGNGGFIGEEQINRQAQLAAMGQGELF
jgi:hypothetical protein